MSVFSSLIYCLLLLFEDNLSYNKLATQSLSYPDSSSGARNAVDKNTATCTRQKDIGFSSLYKTVWWKVDLGGVYNIYSISILFKTYDGYGMYFNPCNYVNKILLELRILEKFDFFVFALLQIYFLKTS